MKQIIYAAQLKGHGTRIGEHLNILRGQITSPSVSITTIAGPDGLSSEIVPVEGGQISFDSEAVLLTESTLVESGTITFGDGKHKLRFSTIGEGFIGPSADPKTQHGCIVWRVDGGEGQFEGASGYITSNFTADEHGDIADHHFGVIWVR